MNPLMDELTFRSYAHNRTMFPDVQPERWAAIFQNVPAMEERFLKTFIAKLMEAAEEIEVADGSGLPNSGVTQGSGGEVTASPLKSSRSECLHLRGHFNTGDGVSSASERKPSGEDSGCQVRSLDAHQAANSLSLPVPLGREVSGTVEGHGNQLNGSSRLQAFRGDSLTRQNARGGSGGVGSNPANPTTNEASMQRLPLSISENQVSPADQISSYFPLAEIVEKVFKQRSFLCN